MYEPDKLFTREKLPEFSPAVVEMEPWRKALMDAAELIRTCGLGKGALVRRDGSYCTLGALTATGWDNGQPRAWTRFGQYLGRDVIEWNDAPETTKEMVIAALEGAARS